MGNKKIEITEKTYRILIIYVVLSIVIMIYNIIFT
jgi:hypothetical protein